MKSYKTQHFNRLSRSLLYILCSISIGVLVYCMIPEAAPKVYTYTISTTQPQRSVNTYSRTYRTDTVLDLNTATFEELLAIGIHRNQTRNIIRYRERGGRFYKKEDILKIYGFTADMYTGIEAYISVEQKKRPHTSAADTRKEKTRTNDIFMFEINTSSVDDLVRIPGIGDYRARKIIEYREKLGGYYNYNQLLEVYSIDSSVITSIQRHTYIDSSHIKKLNINIAEFRDILVHPYGGYRVAKDIMQYRTIQKTITSIEELHEENILTKTEYEKLSTYLQTF